MYRYQYQDSLRSLDDTSLSLATGEPRSQEPPNPTGTLQQACVWSLTVSRGWGQFRMSQVPLSLQWRWVQIRPETGPRQVLGPTVGRMRLLAT